MSPQFGACIALTLMLTNFFLGMGILLETIKSGKSNGNNH